MSLIDKIISLISEWLSRGPSSDGPDEDETGDEPVEDLAPIEDTSDEDPVEPGDLAADFDPHVDVPEVEPEEVIVEDDSVTDLEDLGDVGGGTA